MDVLSGKLSEAEAAGSWGIIRENLRMHDLQHHQVQRWAREDANEAWRSKGIRFSEHKAQRAQLIVNSTMGSTTWRQGATREAGEAAVIPAEIEYKLEDLVLAAEAQGGKEVRRHKYGNWLGSLPAFEDLKYQASEGTRVKWAMPESMKKHYDMVVDLMVKLQIAVLNPFFDPEKEAFASI
ncbi:MAG: hypothetical protein SGPRY_000678 [Prymnesium sp.]